MNSVNLQDVKLIPRNLLHSYTQKKNKKDKLGKRCHLPPHHKIKYLEINLLKKAKDLYSDNYKTLMKEIEEDANRWKDTTLLDCKNQYWQNNYTTQGNLQIQCSHY